MRRAELLQEVLKMRFEEVYEQGGLEGLDHKRLSQASYCLAPVDEVIGMIDEYATRYRGWNVRHYYKYYRQGGGKRGYTWVKNRLQSSGLVSRKAKW